MTKLQETIDLEKAIISTTSKTGTFGCLEVTIGWFGSERVDYITYDTKGIWRCYEIKATKSDFYSDAAKTFVAHYNYFVMPGKLYFEVYQDIPEGIGVYANGNYSVKRARRRELGVDEQILKDSLIRSLARDASKIRKLENADFIERTNRTIRGLRQERNEWQQKYHNLMGRIGNKFGAQWYRENLKG